MSEQRPPTTPIPSTPRRRVRKPRQLSKGKTFQARASEKSIVEAESATKRAIKNLTDVEKALDKETSFYPSRGRVESLQKQMSIAKRSADSMRAAQRFATTAMQAHMMELEARKVEMKELIDDKMAMLEKEETKMRNKLRQEKKVALKNAMNKTKIPSVND